MLIIGGYGSGKTNSLFNLINHQSDIGKIYLNAKDPYEGKYQFLINKREDVGTNYFNDSIAFIEYSNNMVDIYTTLKIIIQIKNAKYSLFLMIWLLIRLVIKT